MNRKILFSLLILIFLVPVYLMLLNHFKEQHYKESPTVVMNKFIWLTTTRIEDTLEISIKETNYDHEQLGQLLTLYGAASEQFSAMLGEDEFPRMLNGYLTNEYLQNKLKGKKDLSETDWETLKKLAALYKELDLIQSQLVDDSGKINKSIKSKIIEIDQKIIMLLKSR